MKTISVYYSVHVPITYDETRHTAAQAEEAALKAIHAAVEQAIVDRKIGLDGKHTDTTGPHLVKTEENEDV
jgi:hypothetical protein